MTLTLTTILQSFHWKLWLIINLNYCCDLDLEHNTPIFSLETLAYNKFWTTAVTLTLNTILQSFHWKFWPVIIYHQPRFGCKVVIFKTVIFWLHKSSLWPWPWRQPPNVFARHLSSWWPIFIPCLTGYKRMSGSEDIFWTMPHRQTQWFQYTPHPHTHTHTHFVTGGIRMVEGKVRTTAMKNVPQYGNMMVLWRKHGHGKYPTVTSKSAISMGTERQQGSLLLLVRKISHFGQQVDNWHRNTCSLREQSGLVRKISHCDQQVNY